MKFLLVAVNAKYIHSNPAIYSLRGYAGAELQSHIELAEYTINNYGQDILADIYQRKPDVIGFSCYIWNWSIIQELLKELPKLLKGVDLWLGGPEVSYESQKVLLQYPQVKGIFVGEGEGSFKEVLEIYVQAAEENKAAGVSLQRLKSCAGLCLHSGFTMERAPLNLNELPFLYDDLTPFANKVIYYESSRGCPYHCSYCLSSIDRRVRLRDKSVVKKELQFFLDNKVKQVKFVDRTFNCNHEHAMAVWQYLYEHDNGVTNFHFEISADILRQDEIELLRRLRPGLVQLEIGVQSVQPRTIAEIERVMNVDRLEGIVRQLHGGKNIHLHLDLIAGLPFEDFNGFQQSFNRVYAMRPEQLQLGFLKVLKGSPMHERAEEYGISYLDSPPYEVLSTKWLDYGHVLRLKAVEQMVELYYNSNQFTHTLSFLERAFDTPFAMYDRLARFYAESGYLQNNPARAYRYQVLFHFAQKYDEKNTAVYRELLTFDMYLREKLKSRPYFAADSLEDDKKRIWQFYQREEQERKYLLGYEGYDWKQMSKMTHLEPFVYQVWDVGALPDRPERGKRVYVLFDYRRRNPLTDDAHIELTDCDGGKENTENDKKLCEH